MFFLSNDSVSVPVYLCLYYCVILFLLPPTLNTAPFYHILYIYYTLIFNKPLYSATYCNLAVNSLWYFSLTELNTKCFKNCLAVFKTYSNSFLVCVIFAAAGLQRGNGRKVSCRRNIGMAYIPCEASYVFNFADWISLFFSHFEQSYFFAQAFFE